MGSIFGMFSAQLPGTYTISTLPDATLYSRKYVWVTDLYGGFPDYLISDGTAWKPVRAMGATEISSSNMTLQPLANPPTLVISGTIGTGVTHTVSLGTTMAWPGARFHVTRKAGGLGTLLIGAGLSMLVNQWVLHEWTGSAWVQTASGGLLS